MTETSTQNSGRRAVLVLGMHRSGTSALARVLNLLGCDLPNHLMVGGESNEHGHWESAEISGLNDRILGAACSRWDDWIELDPNWVNTPAAREFIVDACEAVRGEYDDSSMFVLKDPRMCRIVPFWRKVLARMDIEPLSIIPIRNPLEVALSLAARSEIDPHRSYLMWLRHVLDAEFQTRGMPRCFLTYSKLLEDWKGTMSCAQDQLGVVWSTGLEDAADQIDGFLSADHRHHVESYESLRNDPTPFEWLLSALEIFLRWADAGEDKADLPQLDQIRSAFNVAQPALSGLLIANQESRRAADEILSERDTTIRSLEERLQCIQEELVQREVEIQSLHAHERKAQAEHATRITELERSVNARFEELGAIATMYAQLESVNRDLATGNKDLQRANEALRGQIVTILLEGLASGTLGRGHRLREQADLVRRAGIVDPDWYLERYPDVAQAGIDPALHYVEFGASEGRPPNPFLAQQ